MRLIATALCLLALAAPAAAQTPGGWDAQSPQLTRAELEEMLGRYEETASSNAYSGTIRQRARAEAALIRQRLTEGDVRVGDRVYLIVENQPTLSDTFPVISGRLLRLPTIGDLPLSGVLRSELQAHLTEQIGRFVRSPVVRARSLIRLEILGAVGQPGFYIVPSDVLVSDALMIAGGPHPEADMDKLRITRGSEVIWDGEALRQAVIDGRTLDQLNIQAGDGIYVQGRKSFMAKIAPITGILGAIGSLVWLGVQVF